ncbi:hypothetical protein MRX96_010960 [Rhipicephalus microplus]
MEVTVNGRDADQEELESSDWVTKVSKRVAELQKSQQRERDGATRAASTSSGCGKEGRMMPAGFNGDKHGEKPGVSHKASHDGGDCAQEKSKSTGPQVVLLGAATALAIDDDTESLLKNGFNLKKPMKLPPTESDQSDVPLLSPPVVFNPFFVWLLRETECAGAAPELQLRPTLKGQLEHDTAENPVMRMPFLTQVMLSGDIELNPGPIQPASSSSPTLQIFMALNLASSKRNLPYKPNLP